MSENVARASVSDESPNHDLPRKKRRISIKRLLTGLLVVLALSPFLAWGAARFLITQSDLTHADALVVLGGSASYIERTREAARLYRDGRAPQIILTNDGQKGGWSNALERNPYFVERSVDELVKAGIPPEKIETLPTVVSSTYDEARLLREYAAQHGLRSILVVTSPYHSRRALWTLRHVFQGSGVEIGLVSPDPGVDTPRVSTWWLSRRGWKMVGGEYLKLIYYWVRY